MTAIDNRTGWWADAACLTADPDLFFPVSWSGPALRQVAQAKAICARCQARQACLGYALEAAPVEGIWGGTTEAERRLLGRRLREEHAGPPPGQPAGPALLKQSLSP